MGRYYHYPRHRHHYRSELLAPVAIAGILFVALSVAFISWLIPDEPSVRHVLELSIQTEKPSKFGKFVKGIVRAVKDAVEDDPN